MGDSLVVGSFGGLGIGLNQVSIADGRWEPLTSLDLAAGETAHRWPFFVPDANVVLFTVFTNEGRRLEAVNLDSGRRTPLGIEGVSPQYADTGHLFYAAPDGSLTVLPFDVERLVPTGSPMSLVDRVGVNDRGAAEFAVSSNGRLFHVPVGRTGVLDSLVWVDRGGGETSLDVPGDAYSWSRLSPNGDRLALGISPPDEGAGGGSIAILNLATGVLQALDAASRQSAYPVWTPDGQSIVFSASFEGIRRIYRMRADGAGAPQPLTENPERCTQWPQVITPDRERVVFRQASGGPGSGCRGFHLVPLEDATDPQVLLVKGDTHMVNAEFSPDGRWLAYQQETDEAFVIFVAPVAEVASGTQVSGPGSRYPAWSPDSRELFFLDAESRLVSLPIGPGPDLTLGTPQPLLDATPYRFGFTGRSYEVDVDGQRFLMIRRGASPEVAVDRIRLLMNWHDELDRLTSGR